MISIVVPTLDRADSLKKCLDTIEKHCFNKYTELEAIVIDSSGEKDSSEVSEKYNFVKYYRIDIKNRSYQRNLGILKSTGSIIAFLDDDSFIREEWLDRVLYRIVNQEMDIVGGLVIDKDQELSRFHGTDIIGKVFPDGLTIANFGNQAERMVEVDWLPGGNMAFKRTVFLKIAGFDKTCIGTAGYEETDLCVRAKKAGFHIFFDPEIVIDHVRGKRVDIVRDRDRLRGRYYASRNYTYFLMKNFGLDIRKIFFIYIKETYWQILKFCKKPALYNFVGIFANIFGKIFGTLLVIKYHLLTKWTEMPLLKD